MFLSEGAVEVLLSSVCSLLPLIHPEDLISFSSVVIPPPPLLPSFPCFLNLLPSLSVHHCPLLMNLCFSSLQLFSHICSFLFAAGCWNDFRVVLEEKMFHSADKFISFLHFSAFVDWWSPSSGIIVNISAVSVLDECIFQSRAREPQTRSFIYDIITGRRKQVRLSMLSHWCSEEVWLDEGRTWTDGWVSLFYWTLLLHPDLWFWARPGPTWRLCSLNL